MQNMMSCYDFAFKEPELTLTLFDGDGTYRSENKRMATTKNKNHLLF